MTKGIYIRSEKHKNKLKERHWSKSKNASEIKIRLRKANKRRYDSGEKFGFQKGHKDLVPDKSRKEQGLKMIGNRFGFAKGHKTWNAGKTHSKVTLEKISKASKRMWHNEEIVRKMHESLHKTKGCGPNRPEKKLQDILFVLFGNDYKYVGDLSFWIGRGNPDFLNIKKKKVIEMYGSYWHKNDNPQDRIDYFRKYGYDTLIVWDYELSDEDTIKSKILSFDS